MVAVRGMDPHFLTGRQEPVGVGDERFDLG
jgi:hypothetical protein